MVRRVYLENKIIIFTGVLPRGQADVMVVAGGGIDRTKVLQKVENCNTLYVVSDDVAGVYRDFCARFTCVDAAGGVVRNARGGLLAIYRNGRWDLPKGYRERGEGLRACALREVAEECGIRGMEIVRKLLTTTHIYEMNGEWWMKACRWYEMRYTGGEAPAPQTAEGITRAQWLDGKELDEAFEGSYLTIKEVIKKLKI